MRSWLGRAWWALVNGPWALVNENAFLAPPTPWAMVEGDWLRAARSRIKVAMNKVYLNNASAGPLPTDSVEAMANFLELWSREGEPWAVALEHVLEAKGLFAELIGASPEEVAAAPGVTYGLNAVLSSLDLPRGSNAVVSELNFPTGIHSLHAMRSRGLIKEVRLAKAVGGVVHLGEYEKLIDNNTSIVLVDYVYWLTGYRERIREIAQLAHEKGALVVVDAFHAVGVLPMDVKREGIDVLLCGSYKWLMGPHGAAFVYVRKELINELRPAYSGWMAIEDSVVARLRRGEEPFKRPLDIADFRPAPDASRLEWGTLPLIAFEGTLASLRFIREFNAPGRYSEHTRKLVERLLDGLLEIGLDVVTPRESHAAIVAFRHRDPHGLATYLERNNVIVSARPGLIRVSPHFYNTMEEVESFLDLVASFERGLLRLGA